MSWLWRLEKDTFHSIESMEHNIQQKVNPKQNIDCIEEKEKVQRNDFPFLLIEVCFHIAKILADLDLSM